jgi:Uma2 family endonuclease
MILQEKLSRERFRELYGDRKPAFELIDGEPEQKALGSKKHSRLQWILGVMLEELGFEICPELTLAISETWEPIPDLAGVLGPETDEVYQSEPPAVVIEILSPSDRFTPLDAKCRKYAEWGVPDILAFDPVRRMAWRWDRATDGLARFETYRFSSRADGELSLLEVFQRLDAKRKGEKK